MFSASLVLFASIVLPPQGDSPYQGLSAELHSTHVLSGLEHETIRVYADIYTDARIDAVYGNSNGLLAISSSTGFYQSAQGGPTSDFINSLFFAFDPDLEWDSYVSIGCLYADGFPFASNHLNDIGIDWSGFESGSGPLVTSNGSWFITPDDAQGSEQGGRVFLGQFSIPAGGVLDVVVSLQGKDSNGNTWQETNANCTYPGAPPEPVFINEVRVDQASSDNDEYFELIGVAGASLDGLTYIVIGDGSGGSGVVESISDLAGYAIPTDGIFLAGESSMTIAVPDAILSLGFENSDNVTHMLVAGFTGSSQQDLDTDDDGVFDVTPWTSIVDSVSLVETPNSGEQYYSSNTVGPDGSSAVAHAHVCKGGWEVASYDFTDDTPGGANNCSSITDCNSNGIDDATDISSGTSSDCDVNGVPDECDPDCGTNGIPDDCEGDCDNDGVPDDCEADTNSNGVPDDCEIVDCNNNTIDDATDIANGTSDDCDANGVPDECENLADCNSNGVADACDISSGTSTDANGNGVPDECKGPGPSASINEIRIDQSGSDNDEYVELAAAPGTVLDGLTYVVIGDGSGGSGGAGGSIECAVDITGTVGASGYFLIAENTFTLNGVTPDQVVSNSPFESSLNFENSDNVTHMLVYGFGGAFADDVDADDDGTMDFMPWLELLDSVALIETVGTGELVYSANQVGPNGTYVPAHIYNCGGAWMIGDFGLGVDDTPGGENNCPIGSTYCFGDTAACPCGNGGSGSSGCANSTGSGGTLSASGDPSLSNDTVVLTAEGLVPSLPCLFFSGANRVNGGAGVPFGDGLRCAGLEAVRIEVTNSDASGVASTGVVVSTNGQAYAHTLEVGETVNYQCWYRDDSNTSPCGNSFNTTNGYTLVWNL